MTFGEGRLALDPTANPPFVAPPYATNRAPRAVLSHFRQSGRAFYAIVVVTAPDFPQTCLNPPGPVPQGLN